MATASEQSRRLGWEIEKAEDAFVTAYTAASVQERAEGFALLDRLNRALAALGCHGPHLEGAEA